MHPAKIHQLLMHPARILPFSSAAIREMDFKEVISNAAGHDDDDDQIDVEARNYSNIINGVK